MRMSALPLAALACLATAAPAVAQPAVHRPATVVVQVTDVYTPKTVHIHVGDTVKWVFPTHTVHSVHKGMDPSRPCKAVGILASGPKRNGQTYSYRFTQAATVVYFSDVETPFCTEGLIGRVEVDD